MKRNTTMNTNQNNIDYQFTVLVIGDSGVGKSDFVTRFAEGTYTENYIQDYNKKSINLDAYTKIRTLSVSGKTCRLKVWDWAGHELSEKNWYKHCNLWQKIPAVIIGYDITCRESFENVKKHLDKAQKRVSAKAQILLVGMKLDFSPTKRVVLRQEAKEFADQHNLGFIEISAKEDINVDEAFVRITQAVVWSELNDGVEFKMGYFQSESFIQSDYVTQLSNSLQSSKITCGDITTIDENRTTLSINPNGLSEAIFANILQQQTVYENIKNYYAVTKVGKYDKFNVVLQFTRKSHNNNNNSIVPTDSFNDIITYLVQKHATAIRKHSEDEMTRYSQRLNHYTKLHGAMITAINEIEAGQMTDEEIQQKLNNTLLSDEELSVIKGSKLMFFNKSTSSEKYLGFVHNLKLLSADQLIVQFKKADKRIFEGLAPQSKTMQQLREALEDYHRPNVNNGEKQTVVIIEEYEEENVKDARVVEYHDNILYPL